MLTFIISILSLKIYNQLSGLSDILELLRFESRRRSYYRLVSPRRSVSRTSSSSSSLDNVSLLLIYIHVQSPGRVSHSLLNDDYRTGCTPFSISLSLSLSPPPPSLSFPFFLSPSLSLSLSLFSSFHFSVLPIIFWRVYTKRSVITFLSCYQH